MLGTMNVYNQLREDYVSVCDENSIHGLIPSIFLQFLNTELGNYRRNLKPYSEN